MLAESRERWLVTGARGMLARELVSVLARQGTEVLALSRDVLDVTDIQAVRSAMRTARPDVVVNCAAWTSVDLAESNECAAYDVNATGPKFLATSCSEIGARMIQISTDYVFDGLAQTPYSEDAQPNPKTAYGRTKLAGERTVLDQLPASGYVVRTGWLYGRHGANFVHTILRLERERSTVAVVNDQYGQPTSVAVVAGRIIALANDAPPGIYHATCSGQASRFDFARHIFQLTGADPERVTAISSSELNLPAERPGYSVLSHGAWANIGLGPPDNWMDSLSQSLPALAAEINTV